jgi:thiol-disulfide isomerase/thioredoxin
MRTKVIIIILFVFGIGAVYGQKDTVKSLLVGDQVPDLVFGNVLNYKNQKARLSDFRGKLVILDMWSVFCTSCIAGFPKMDSLQKEFGDKIQILLVNPHDPKYDSEEKIRSTLERLKIRTGFYPSLPIPIYDFMLNKYFPHQSVPHQVWISSTGKVAAITGSEEATRENIAAFLKTGSINAPVKDDWSFDAQKPLLLDNNAGNANDFIYRSVFTGYKEGIGYASGVRKNSQNKVTGLYMLNNSLISLVMEAHPMLFNNVDGNRIILDVKNPMSFNNEFDTAHIFCYDLTIPPVDWTSVNFEQYLKTDLKNAFNISVKKEKRKMSCLVISENAKLANAKTRYIEAKIELDNKSIKKFIHRYTVSSILKVLLGGRGKPFIDETKYKELIDIDLPNNFDLSNSKRLINFLESVGFEIREEERELDVVVISDK